MIESNTMPPELKENIDGLEFAKSEVADIADGLSHGQFNWRAEEGSWSVGECIDHLYQTGFHLHRVMTEEMDIARKDGRTKEGPFKYSFVGNFFVKSAGVPKKTDKGKVSAPKLYLPGAEFDRDELIPKFVSLQDDLIAMTRAADGLDLKRIKVTSPAVKIVRVSLGIWLKLLPNHQKRHFLQARRVLASMPKE